MHPEEIKKKITALSQKHSANNEETMGDIKNAELIELEAEELIISYCEKKKYLINGFPTEKRRIYEEEGNEDYDEDYFSIDRYRLYLDMLTIEKEDVAQLTWHYTSNFWPDFYESKEDFIEDIKHRINNTGFYELTI
jgi:hypothetical protein